MNFARPHHLFFALAFSAGSISALGLAGCASQFTHVTPGQSARQTLAARNAPPPVIPQLAGANAAQPLPSISSANQNAAGPLVPPPLPDIQADPSLPAGAEVANQVADAYTRGSFAMQAGQNADAIVALEEAVKLDPNFTDAWTKLVKLYERTGNMGKAMDAYRKLKQLGLPNGATGTSPTGGLGLSR